MCKDNFFPIVWPLYFDGACWACNVECAQCNSSPACLTCVDPNASPSDTGCYCNDAFWGIAPLSTAGSCMACPVSCVTCYDSWDCLACVDPNASPSTVPGIGCACKDRFYNSCNSCPELLLCAQCNPDCATCSDGTSCLTCVDSNASPDFVGGLGCVCNSGTWGISPLNFQGACVVCDLSCSTCVGPYGWCVSCVDPNALAVVSSIECVCMDGFWGVWPLSYVGSCVTCGPECLTCDSGSACLSCIDANSSPSTATGGMCSCNQGFWGIAPLISADSCMPCYPDCFSCASALSCLSCIDPNATPNVDLGCSCNNGY